MAINSIKYDFNTYKQPSFKQQKKVDSYLEKESAVKTDNFVHPQQPQGHLVNDSFSNSLKYFFKDIKYSLKSVKDGYDGKANDHQLGRLNDVGLVAAGVLIATYLASKTKNPKTRLMEYVGLGAFLTAMAVYPKLAINTPAKLVHGYDIDKEYIDDQGRKKSVMQDPNYVPYDMYLGNVPEEDISKIGDRMGIPKDIVNRNDVVKEQMRKIATQNNTLWMLTACVTPALSGLMCYGIENYIAEPLVEKAKLAKVDSNLAKILKTTNEMSSNIDTTSLKSCKLSNRVNSLLSNYKGQELPKQEFENLISLLTEDLYANTAEGIRADVSKILKTSAINGEEAFVIDEETAKKIKNIAENAISKNQKNQLEQILVPSREEIDVILKKYLPENSNLKNGIATSTSNIASIKNELSKLIDSKIQNSNGIPKEFLNSRKSAILNDISQALKAEKSCYVSEEGIKKLVDFAKIIGEFKNNQATLKNIAHSLIEDENGTIIANSYGKFEKTLLDVLDIKYKDLKKMGESEAYTKELIDKKITELCKDEARYEKAIEKFGKVISEMEMNLNGKSENKSRLLDLINATENNYNNTAKRVANIGDFKETVSRLVKEDIETLGTTLKSKQELFDFMDGIIESKYKTIGDWNSLPEDVRIDYLKNNSKGVGSSKNLEIARCLERYQGAKNSLNRIIHTFDIYKRAQDPSSFMKTMGSRDSEYIEAIIKEAKEMMLSSTSSDHTMKLNLVNNPNFYRDLFYSTHATEIGDTYSTKQKGFLDPKTKQVLEKFNSLLKGNLLDREQSYITRFRNIVANSTVDFTKPDHILNPYVRKSYTNEAKTRTAFFNLIGQNPVELIKNAASKRYSTQKWFRKIGIIAGSITGFAILTQFFFGKLSNPQNLKKQVNDDSNK